MLVGLVIEQALLKTDKTAFDRVEALLLKRHHCTIADCYENPQYLNEALNEIFGKSYLEILKSIEECLMDFRYEQPIEEFIERMNR